MYGTIVPGFIIMVPKDATYGLECYLDSFPMLLYLLLYFML